MTSTLDPTRISAAGLIALILIALWYTGASELPTLFLLPLILGATLSALRLSGFSTLIDSWGDGFVSRRARINSESGKLARYFLRPVCAIASSIWSSTAGLTDHDLRAGLRLTSLLYLLAFALAMLLLVGYAMLMALVFFLVACATLWLIGYALSGGSSSVRVPSVSSWFRSSRKVHRDVHHRVVGESRKPTLPLGDARTTHFDASGQQTGESRETTGVLFGNAKTVHYDQQGNETGESRTRETLLSGWPALRKAVTDHHDEAGNTIGESREGETLPHWPALSQEVADHYDKEGNKIGETR